MNTTNIYHRGTQLYASAINQYDVNIKLQTNKTIQRVLCHYGDPHLYHQINGEYIWKEEVVEMNLVSLHSELNFFQIDLSCPNRRLKYFFELIDEANEHCYYGERGFYSLETKPSIWNAFFYHRIHDNEILKPLPHIIETTWVQIFVERYANGNPNNDPAQTYAWSDPITKGSYVFYGGDLQGILDHLDDLKQQGFTGIYLTPIFKSGSNHKYDTQDYTQIDPYFGDNELFKKLVNTAHDKGIKIMIDIVFNHCGLEWFAFKDVQLNKENSRYKDWFFIQSFEPLKYDTFSYVPHMPKLNTTNPELRKLLMGYLVSYVQDFKVDGLRFDVASEIEHSFFREVNHTLKALNPNLYLLCEVWSDVAEFVTYDQFDASMEYMICDFFMQWQNHEISTRELIDIVADYYFKYPINSYFNSFHMIDSHDTARMITRLHHNQNKALQTIQFLTCQKGSICLYYGTHYLLEGENDPYCRAPYPHTPTAEQLVIQDQVNQLLQFRKEHFNQIQNEVPAIEQHLNSFRLIYSDFEVTFNRFES